MSTPSTKSTKPTLLLASWVDATTSPSIAGVTNQETEMFWGGKPTFSSSSSSSEPDPETLKAMGDFYAEVLQRANPSEAYAEVHKGVDYNISSEEGARKYLSQLEEKNAEYLRDAVRETALFGKYDNSVFDLEVSTGTEPRGSTKASFEAAHPRTRGCTLLPDQGLSKAYTDAWAGDFGPVEMGEVSRIGKLLEGAEEMPGAREVTPSQVKMGDRGRKGKLELLFTSWTTEGGRDVSDIVLGGIPAQEVIREWNHSWDCKPTFAPGEEPSPQVVSAMARTGRSVMSKQNDVITSVQSSLDGHYDMLTRKERSRCKGKMIYEMKLGMDAVLAQEAKAMREAGETRFGLRSERTQSAYSKTFPKTDRSTGSLLGGQPLSREFLAAWDKGFNQLEEARWVPDAPAL
ncbi:hypothetical protein IAT38_005938 [Cryptococcus sp. DSM 104549]